MTFRLHQSQCRINEELLTRFFASLCVFPAAPKVLTAEMKMCGWVCMCVADRAISRTLTGVFPTPRARVYVPFVSVCMCALGLLGNLMTYFFF